MFGPPQKPWLWTEKTRRRWVYYIWGRDRCEILWTQALSRPSLQHGTDNKVEVLVTWTFCFPPKRQLSTLLNSFFPFIDIWYFSQVLNFTSVELNRFAKQAKLLKTLFFKSDGGHARSRQEKRRLPKNTARFPAKKRWHSPPPVGLSWTLLSLPQSLYGQAYADVTTKISRLDRLPNLLSNGAPLTRKRAGSSIKNSTKVNNLLIYCTIAKYHVQSLGW